MFLTLVSSTEEGHICRPPMKELMFFFIIIIYIYIFLSLTTPGFRLMGAARLDGMQRVGKGARLADW